MKDFHQTGKYAEYIKNIGWTVDKFDGTFIYYRKILFWNFVKIQRPKLSDASGLLGFLEKKYRFSTVYFEPIDDNILVNLLRLGFRKSNSPFLPTKTVQIDLTRSEEKILSLMHHKTRYNIKKNLQGKFSLVTSGDIEKFAEFWQKCAKERGMFLSQKSEIKAVYRAFGKDAMIHVAQKEKNNWLAAVLRISAFDSSHYLYAASSKEGNKLFAPTAVAWDAITSSKKEGWKIFDFEGIFDERFPINTWKGFTKFKTGFGGSEVLYPGCLIKFLY